MKRHRFRAPWALVAAAAMIASLVVVAAASAATTATVVRATPAFEWLPIHSGIYTAWTQRPTNGSPASSNRVWVQVGKGTPFKVGGNAESYTGDISGNILVFQQNVNGRSSIRFYNLVTRTFLASPPEINLNGTERRPSMVGNMDTGWLVFGRQTAADQNIILFSMKSHHSITIGESTTGADPGQINVDSDTDSPWPMYASFRLCNPTRCDVVSYGFRPGNPTGGRYSATGFVTNATRYGPAVSDDGTTFFVSRSLGEGCGADAQIRAFPWGATSSTLVYDLPAGMDSFHTYVDKTAPEGNGLSTTAYFDRYACGGDSNLWKLTTNQP